MQRDVRDCRSSPPCWYRATRLNCPLPVWRALPPLACGISSTRTRRRSKPALLPNYEISHREPSSISARSFWAHLGHRNVEVTRQYRDGGIDGHGDFRQGAISIRSAFQAKRWTDNPVGRPEIDRFRGAIQGEYDHGVFLTTSRFSKDAMEASYKKGAITILLLDGQAIADLLVERGLGVRKLPLYLFDIDEEFFDIQDE